MHMQWMKFSLKPAYVNESDEGSGSIFVNFYGNFKYPPPSPLLNIYIAKCFCNNINLKKNLIRVACLFMHMQWKKFPSKPAYVN